MHAKEARGPCWARALAMGQCQGEDWFCQVDLNTWFERLLQLERLCAERNPRCPVSSSPNPLSLRGGEPFALAVSPQVLAHVVSEGAEFAPDHPVLSFEGVAVTRGAPVPGRHVAAGCLPTPSRLRKGAAWIDLRPYFQLSSLDLAA